ncbi:hypothetical protein LCGC14_2627730, partial [marine sediment metagenome]
DYELDVDESDHKSVMALRKAVVSEI